MNVKSFADLQDCLIEPDDTTDLKRAATTDEDDYGEDFEEVDSDFEGRTVEAGTKEFSIEARGSEDDVLLQNSRSYSRIEVRKSMESDEGAEAVATIKSLENVSVSGSEEDENDDVVDMPTPAKPDEVDIISSRPDVIEISGDVPRRATAPPLQAALKVPSGKSTAKKSNKERVLSVEEKILQGKRAKRAPDVKAPTKAFISMNSKIKVASHWEVPGVSIYEGAKVERTDTGSKAPNSKDEADYSAKSDREKIVLTVLDLLQSAAKKAQTQKDVETAMKGHAIRIPSVRSGVSKKQALRATGKMCLDNVPDYDPDFEMALEFMRSNDWEANAAFASASTSEGERANTYGQSADLALIGSGETKESSDGRVYYAPGTEGQPQQRGSTFPPQAKKPSIGNNRGNMNVSAPAAPVPTQSPGEDPFHPIYGRARGYVDSPPVSTPAADEHAAARGAPNFEADKDLRAVNSSIENYATWLKPNYLKRASVLASVPVDEAADLSNKCEKLYAAFLQDLIHNCKTRADNCSTTEEMAMLRVLAEQVTSKFAVGEPQEDLQCRMIQGALTTMPFMMDKKHAQARTFDESVGIPSIGSGGLRANRDRIGGFHNR